MEYDPLSIRPRSHRQSAVRPTSRRRSPKPAALTDTYLTDAMRTHLDQEEATFDFLVQFHVDDRRTPIEDATVEWRTQDAPYHASASSGFRDSVSTIPSARLAVNG